MAITADELRVVVNAEVKRAVRDLGKVDKQIKQTQTTAEKMSKGVKALGANLLKLGLAGGATAAAIAGFKALTRSVKENIEIYRVQEQAETALASAIKSTGRQSEISAQSIIDYAGELQSLTLYGDEATISAAAMLQSLADLDEDGLKQVLPRIQDLATAMDMDLKTAASLVGKTLGSETNALSRYGVEIDAQASKTEKLAELTDELSRMFGGAAEAAGETATGSFEQLSNAMGDLREEFGRGVANGLEPFARGLTDLVSGITETVSAASRLSGTWTVVGEETREAAGSVVDFVRGYKSATQQAEELKSELEDSLLPINAMIDGFDSMTAEEKLAAVNTQLEDVRSQLEGLSDDDLVAAGGFFSGDTMAVAAEAVRSIVIPALKEAREIASDISFDELSDRGKISEIQRELSEVFAFIDEQAETYGDAVDVVQLKNKAFGEALARLAQYGFRDYGDGILYLRNAFADELNPAIDDANKITKEYTNTNILALDIANKLAKNQREYEEQINKKLAEKRSKEREEQLRKEEEAARDLSQAYAEAQSEMDALAASIITDLGNAMRTGDVSNLAEGIGSTIGSAVGMIAGGPVGAAIGQQLGSFLGSLIDGAVATPEFIKSAGDAMASLDSTFASVIASGGGLDEFSDALDAKLRQVIVDQLIKSIRLEEDLKRLGKAMAKALEDGVVTSDEKAFIQGMMDSIKVKGEAVSAASNDLFDKFGIAPSSNEQPRSQPDPQPYIGPQQTAGGAQRGGGDVYVTVNGSVMREDEITDSIFANGHRRGVA